MKLDVGLREVLSGAGTSFFWRAGGAVAQFVLAILLARFFGAEGIGLYSLALVVSVIASTVSRWGIDLASMKLIAVARANDQSKKVGAMYRVAVLSILVFGVIATALLFALSPFVATVVFGDPALSQVMQAMVLSVVPFSLLNLCAECLRAEERVAMASFLQGSVVPIITLLLVAVLYAEGASIRLAALCYVSACIISAVVAGWVWHRSLKLIVVEGEFVRFPLKELLITANPMAWVAIVSIVMGFLETIILGVYASSEEVGLYSAALRLAMILSMVTLAFNSILSPKFAALYAKGEVEKMVYLARKSMFVMLLTSSPILIIYLFASEFVLGMFGDEFVQAAVVLQILVIGQVINIAAGPVAAMLMMSGHAAVVSRIVMVALLFGIAIGMVLISQFGMIGAAWTASMVMLILTVSASLSVRKYLKVKIVF